MSSKLFRIQMALVAAQLAALFTFVTAVVRIPTNILACSTTLGAFGLWLGATAALRAKTWGVGLAFAAAVSFGTAAALEMGPWWFWLIGLAGAFPMALGARPFATFGRGAAILFAGGAAAVGLAAALTWHEVWPYVWQLSH